ncbi:MAG: carboxypeptidase regulatory-like domain-containing protein [Acidobacteria bacterium]|nr:MAG: carboxypeptidase regulatory-like domain-containing protein [Acidobacteriota bacterium]
MFTKRVGFCCSCLLILLCICTSAAMGQSTGTVSGTVTDSSGGVVAGCTVYLKDAATGSARTTSTNDNGFFVLAYVSPGTYTVTVTKQGFKTTAVSNQVVEVGKQLTVNAVLEVGSISNTVEVTFSPGAELQTMDATVGATLSGETLINLPNTTRDASTLAVLQPGQNINGNVGGAASDQNTFTLDGGYATDDMSGDNNTYIRSFSGDTGGGTGAYHSSGFNQAPSAVVPIPVTSVEVFKVSTANQTADFTGGAGSEVQVVTKRGTNALHGGVYEYYLDTNFAGANTWDNNRINRAQPSSHFNRFGAFAGGKIPHSNFLGGSWYMFGNYEGFRFPQSATFSRNFPTASLRAGLLKLNGEVVNLNPVATVDPATGTSYAANAATCVDTVNGCNKGTIPAGTVIPCPGPGGGAPAGCDPRGLGLNPVITTLWNTYLPIPNDCGRGDGVNYCGYVGTIATPQTSNFGVARIDHDFAKNWHFNGTYHYYKLTNTVSDQWDIGGFFPGDTKGQYAAIRQKPQNAWIYTAGLTTDIKPGLTNDFHFSYTRNWWAYLDPSGVPNVAGYPAALEVGGENSGAGSSPVFIPYNTNNQNVRTRYWNGHDFQVRDDVSWIKGSHVFQMGGTYLRNIDTHKRNDNGQSINTYEQYLIGEGNGVSLASLGIDMKGYVPAGVSANKYGNLYSMVLGMVDSTQGLFSRGLGSLTTGLPLNPQASCAISSVAATAACVSSPPLLSRSILPSYSLYWTDSWRMKPKFTLNYGIGYTIELPPYETTGGTQTVMVDQNDNVLYAEQYLKNVQQAALQGIAYDPQVGFASVRNVNHHSKYPYDPYYGEISPRIGAAWNFLPNTVLRGGYARIFGRINGVNPLLVPMLTPGLLQPDTCGGPNRMSGGCGGDPSTTFRVGVDCPAGGSCVAPLPLPTQNLPQPWYPGVNDIATGAGETFDPNFKPNKSDEFTLNIQHQFGPKILAEAGYIGRRITNEIEYYGLGVVPYMMTVGGQSFANAWKNVMATTNYGTNVPAPTLKGGGANPAYLAYLNSLPAQPFFESALNPSYCGSVSGATNCTAAFVANNVGNMSISDAFDAWSSVSCNGATCRNFWNFGRTLAGDAINGPFGANGQSPSLTTTVSNGYGNYNAAFLQLTLTNWHGLTMKTNFTWSKALGTGNVVQATSSYATVDPWNLRNQYGPQYYDEKYNFNLFFNYAPPFYSSQKGALGRVLGGWSFSPLFVYGSGFPAQAVTPNNCGSFGECNPAYIGTYENMVFTGPTAISGSRHSNTFGTSCGTAGPGQNVFSNPDASCPVNGGIFGDPLRNPILGLDGQIGGGGIFRGLPFWNLDLGITKKVRLNERFSGSMYFDFTNVLNHMQPADPCFNASDTTTWGVLGCGGAVQANTPRRFQIGFSIDF